MKKKKSTKLKAEEMHKAYLEMITKYGEMHERYSPEALIKGGLFAALEGVFECAPSREAASDTIISMVGMITQKLDDEKAEEEKFEKKVVNFPASQGVH